MRGVTGKESPAIDTVKLGSLGMFQTSKKAVEKRAKQVLVLPAWFFFW